MISEDRLKELAMMQATDSQPQLQDIAEKAAERHRIDTLHTSRQDSIKIAFLLSEVQHNSFMLGMQKGIELITRLAEAEASEEVEQSNNQ